MTESVCVSCGEVLMAHEVEVTGDILGQNVWLAFCWNMNCPRYGLYTLDDLEVKELIGTKYKSFAPQSENTERKS